MKESKEVWVVEDQSLIVDMYQHAFEKALGAVEFTWRLLPTFLEAHQSITQALDSPDWLILDRQLPDSVAGKNQYGTDLLGPMAQQWPHAAPKVLIITAQASWLQLALWSQYPAVQGIWVKSDLQMASLVQGLQSCAEGHKVYSPSVQQLLRQSAHWAPLGTAINRQIIEALDLGLRGESIAQRIGCSLSAVNKHKAEMKWHLMGDNVADEVFLQALRNHRIIL